MKTSTQITIKAPYERIFDLAAQVEDWGEILPHYRYVRLLTREGNRKWVRMSAWRDIVPVTWSAIETVEPGTASAPGRILFKHIKGLVRGMEVEWSFKPRGDYVLVTIAHDLQNPPFPVRILGKRLLEIVVGKGFIGYIAGKTLRRIKAHAEREITGAGTATESSSRSGSR
jgi:ribosome-associated toxin RatA of RatAB toxin-antitoxin module